MPVSSKPSVEAPPSQAIPAPPRLNSWKEIGSYFDRDVRTVQLWEKREGLPVHRHGHGSRSSVYALPSELEAWLAQRERHGASAAPIATPPNEEKPSPPSGTGAWPRSRVLTLGTAALVLLAAAAATGWWMHHRSRTPPTSLTVVLADFVNTTGEPVFDETLNTALRAKLQQTPYLPLMPDARLQLALRYMGRPSGERLTFDLAREACQRETGQVVLQGMIANASKGYLVSLRAIDCRTGRPIAQEQESVEFRTSVLDGLDRTVEGMRRALGESSDSIRRYAVSLDDATTGSLDALTEYTQGNRLWNSQGESAALPHFQHAVELDPNFAIAYARLGTIYGNMGELDRSNEALRRAYDLRNRVTEWERYYIASHYFGFVTGDIPAEMHSYQQWAQAYPHDMAWTINLSVDYGMTGQLEKAIDLDKRAIQEIPGLSPAYGDLAQFYLAAGRPDEAQAVLDQANQLHVRDSNTQLAAYWLGFYRGQPATMDSVARATEGQAGLEDVLFDQQAATADFQGRLADGLNFARRAAQSAAKAGNPEIRSNWLAREAFRQALFGRTALAHQLLNEALSSSPKIESRDLTVLADLAITLSHTPPAGSPSSTADFARVRRDLDSLNRAYPADSLVQSYWLPLLRARLALADSHYAEALQITASPNPYDLGIFGSGGPGQCMDLAYLRAQAMLADSQPAAAADQFRLILAHRGLVLNCPTGAAAQLGLARSLALAGDTPGSRATYQDLFSLWKHADPDMPLLHQAQAEYRALPR